MGEASGYLVFGQRSRIDPVALVQLVQNDGQTFKLAGSHRLQFRGEFVELEDRFGFVENLLQTLEVKGPEAMAS